MSALPHGTSGIESGDAGISASNPKTAWVETCALTLVALLVCLWSDPDNPLLVGANFPWLVLVPMVPGLRYGFAHGTLSAVGCILFATAAWFLHRPELPGFPVDYALSFLAVGMMTGEFVDMWKRRVFRLEAVRRLQRSRSEEFTRVYHLLRMSHARLEQQILGTSVSLRSALLQLKRKIHSGAQDDWHQWKAAGEHVMTVLRDFGHLHTAALYWVDARGNVVTPPVAELGKPPALALSNSLVVDALEKACVTAIDLDQHLNGDGLLAVIPLVDIDNRVWGIVTVYEMPLFAFKQKILDGLAVLAGHIGDMFMQNGMRGDGTAVLSSFRYAVRRCLYDVRKGQGHLPASLVSIYLPSGAAAQEVAPLLDASARGVDRKWLLAIHDTGSVVLLLLPLTDAKGATEFAQRIGDLLVKQFGTGFVNERVNFSVRQLTERDSARTLVDQIVSRFSEYIKVTRLRSPVRSSHLKVAQCIAG